MVMQETSLSLVFIQNNSICIAGSFNTDNCGLLGMTIDFGTFGFMEEYNEGLNMNRLISAIVNVNCHLLYC